MKKILAPLFLLALVGCGETSSTTEDSTQPEATTEQVETEQVEEAIEVTADELLAVYKENELAGDQQFKGKRLIVTGQIDSIQSGMGDAPFVTFKAGDEFEFNSPQAHFEDSELDKLVQLKKGESLTVECEGDGEMMGSPMLSGCTIK